jgi:hypothetical protein
MSNHNLTCEERIANAIKSAEEFYTDRYKQIDEANEKSDYEAEEGLREELQPYGVTITHVMRLELAGGGPAYWIEAELDQERWGYSVGRLVFHYSDWFDHAERIMAI